MGKRENNISTLLKFYFSRSGRLGKFVWLNFLCITIVSALQSLMPWATGKLIDNILKDSGETIRKWSVIILISFIAISLVYYFLEYYSKKFMAEISNVLKAKFQIDLYEHLQHLSEDFYHKTKVGEVVTRLTTDMNEGIDPFYMHISQGVWALTMTIITFIAVSFINWKLSVILLASLIFWTIYGRVFFPKVRKLRRLVNDERGKLNARITENIAMQNLIRMFAREEKMEREVASHINKVYIKSLKSVYYTIGIVQANSVFIEVLAPLGMLTLGALMVDKGITIGELVAIYGYWWVISNPFASLFDRIPVILSTMSSLDRIMEFFNETPLVKDSDEAKPLNILRGNILLDNISFAYPQNPNDIILEGLSLSVDANKNLALVGESGSGKSTLVRLIMRIYDPISGDVMIDGVNLKDITQKSLRSQIGLVMQDPILLSGTIRDNLKFINKDATDKDIINALKNAEAWMFVKSFPNGLDTVVGERGVKLSGGQKQRIAIARTFLMNPPIAIFDEATSALDTITERAIQSAMTKLFKNRTSIIVAHRLSTIINCDKIAVFKEGKLLATGTHKELLKKCDYYKDLCKEQML